MAGTTARPWWPAVVVPAALGGVLLAWVLAVDPVLIDTGIRSVADVAGAVLLGIGLLTLLAQHSRHVDTSGVWRIAAVTAGCWAVCEAALLVFGAARSGAVPATDMSLAMFADYLQNIAGGRIGTAVVVVSVAMTILATTTVRLDLDISGIVVVVPTSIALIVRPMTGHMSQQPAGALLVALHVLAASIWLGLLLAMAVALRTRTSWAELLPRYSTIALWCVVVVTITGAVDAAVRLGSLDALTGTDYGRLVLAKTALVVLLVAAGGWQRRTWVREIGSHRTDAAVSIRRAVTETAAMAVAFGVAAALATTA